MLFTKKLTFDMNIAESHKDFLKTLDSLECKDVKKDFEQDINEFLRYIAGDLDKHETALINEIRKAADYPAFFDERTIPDDDFIPRTIRFFVASENKAIEKGFESRSFSKPNDSISCALYKVFGLYGYRMLICDNELNADEITRFTLCMKRIQSYIYKELNKTNIGTALRLSLGTCDNDPKNTITISEKSYEAAAFRKAAEAEAAKEDTKEEPAGKSEKPDPLSQLNDLVGLESVKDEVTSMINLIKVRKLRKERGMKDIPMSYHMVFTGNPGTGKTTVARLIAEIFREYGVLSKGILVETDRSGLVGEYIGQTALKVKKKVEEALGGILFIDEAYSLYVSDSSRDFGHEATDTLVKAMEDHRSDLVVIAAGYTEPMQKFINSNPGLRSRFNIYLDFPDYNSGEMTDIFLKMCSDNGYELGDEAKNALSERFADIYKHRTKSFGNAREVRNIFEKAVTKQASRIAGIESPTDKELVTFEADDLA